MRARQRSGKTPRRAAQARPCLFAQASPYPAGAGGAIQLQDLRAYPGCRFAQTAAGVQIEIPERVEAADFTVEMAAGKKSLLRKVLRWKWRMRRN